MLLLVFSAMHSAEIGVSRLLVFSLLGIGVMLSACSQEPESSLAFINANIIAMDSQYSNATALLVKGDRIIAVGSDAEIKQQIAAETKVIDLNGKTLLPGFNDAHMHAMVVPPTGVAVGAPITEKDELIEVLAARVKDTPPGHWIIGYGYDDKVLGKHLERSDLDRVSTVHPVVVWHTSFHIMAVNSYALEISGIDKNTQDPEDGFFYRDDDGEPTGLLGEKSALEMLVDVNNRPPLVTGLSSAREQLDGVYRKLHSLGITSISDAMVPPELFALYWLSSPEEKDIRVNLMLDDAHLDFAKWVIRIDKVAAVFGFQPFNNKWLRAKTVKVFHGLSLSGRTARLYKPYHDRPDYYGVEPQRTQQELNDHIQEIHDAGMQAAVHSNGDYEIDMVLTAIENAQSTANSIDGARHRIEHGTVVNDKILRRMKDLNIVLAPHSYINEKGHLLEAYGPERWDKMLPNAASFEYGIPNAGNSDFPVSKLNPLLRIQSLVTRISGRGKTYGASQRLTVEQALQVYTLGGAYASFQEAEKGSITPGKLADLVVLSDDPREVEPELIHTLKVDKTFVGGVEVFSR